MTAPGGAFGLGGLACPRAGLQPQLQSIPVCLLHPFAQELIVSPRVAAAQRLTLLTV